MEQKQNKFKKKVFSIIPDGDCITPKRMTKNSAGYYLIIPEDVKIAAHSRTAICLNYHFNLPVGVVAEIKPLYRNSSVGIVGYGTKTIKEKRWLFTKKKQVSGHLTFDADVLQSVIDASTDCAVKVVVKNNDEEFMLRRGTKLAMITFHSAMSPFIAKIVEQSVEETKEEQTEENEAENVE